MIKNIIVKHSYNFNCKLLKHSFNQITTNKVLDTKSTNKVFYLNIAPNNLTKSTGIKSFHKTYNKTTISYNHFKGSKKAFNYILDKSIKLERFCRVGMLKGFKIGTNKKVRLKIYKWVDYKRGLVEIIVLISSFSWDRVWIELYLTNLLKIESCTRFPAQINPISEWVILPKTAKALRFGEIFNFISG